MPYNVSRLTANGDILLNGTFDEVTLNSGSIRFDGSSSYLTVPDNATLNMGTSDFTVECWIYLTSTPSGYGTFILNKDGLENTSWPQYALFVNSQRNVCVSLSATPNSGGSPTALLTGSTKISLGTWYHVAFTRSGTSGTLWINGVSDGIVTNIPANLTTRNAILVIGYEIRLSLTPSLIFPGYITNVHIVKGNVLYVSNFSPITKTLIPRIANTSLLLNVTDTYNFLKDGSNNNSSITNTGGLFTTLTPFNTTRTDIVPTYGSIFLNGSGTRLSTPSSTVFSFATGDFTIECWFYIRVSPSSGFTQLVLGAGDINNIGFGVSGNPIPLVYYDGSGAGGVRTLLNTPVINTWYHVAVSRQSGTTSGFVNGTLIGSWSDPSNVTAARQMFIGSDSTLSTSFNGYLSSVRIVKGTAVYTAAFTPPTLPVSAISGTSLLLNASTSGSYLTDSSVNNFTLTTSGSPTFSTLTPFTTSTNNLTKVVRTTYDTMYSSEFDEVRAPIVTEGLQLYVDPSKTECIQRNFNTRVTDLSSNLLNGTIVAGPGISGDFIVYNGSTQYITFGNNTANLDLSSKTFTAWIFPSAFTAINPIIGKWYASGGWAFQINTSGRLIFSIGGTDYVDTGPPLIANIWYFVAVTYDYANNIATFYKNGAVTSSVLNRAIIEASSSTELLQIGASRGTLTAPRLFFNGAIGPLYAYNRVLTRDEILTNFNVDKDRTIFFNRNLSGSIFFNGSTDYLSVPSANIPALSGQFTIEFWVNFSSISGTNQTICGKWRGSFYGWIIQINNTECRFFYGDGVNFLSSIGYATTFSSGLWYHIAITRNSSNAIQAYLNGSAIGSPSTVSNSFNSVMPLLIASNDGSQFFNGYISDFRIVNGTAVYTSNFTVPSSSLTAISGTSLLLNSLTSSTYIKDSSANNLTVTSVGTPSYSSSNPFSTSITSNTTNITKWAKTERSSGALMTRGYLDENTGVNTVNVAISGAVSATWTTYQTTSYAFTANGTYFIIPNGDVVMTAKVWGAAGAGSTAGAGGYSTGDIYMAADSLYTVVVGGGGINSSEGSGGGGFSGLFVTDTSGNTSIISQTQALMIAGGGGGASASDPGTGKGGAGGGLTGQDGQTWSGPGSTGGGLGGTQTAGGRATGLYANTGSALQGGSGSGSGTQVPGGTPGGGGAGLNTSWGGSGGGGGYWGGGAGQSTVTSAKGHGGGGSGYLHPILVTNGATIAGNNSIVANASDVDRGTTAGAPTSTIGGSGRIVLSVKRVINSPGLRGSSVAAVSSISYVTSGLIIMYDAAIASSYSGSGTTWTDIGSSGNSGTLVGATYNPAGYFAFNGSSTYMYTTSSIANINTINFTLSGWFQMSAAGGSGKIVGFENQQTGTGSSAWDKNVYVNSSGQLVWGVYNGIVNTIASSAAVNNGVWHHYAAIYNYSGGQIQLYVDGVSVGTLNVTSTDAGPWLRFGSYKQSFWPGGNDGYWTGNMSNFMMYNRVLTAPEVSQNFNAFRSRYGV